MKSARLFVACDLPAHVKTRLAAVQKMLQQSGADVKWAEPHNLHLTLKFLGATDREKIPEIKKALDALSRGQKSFVAQLDRLGVFGPPSAPRVIWAGLRDETPLRKIALAVEKGLLPLGFPQEARRFQAHLTLGRIRSSRNRVALADLLANAQETFKEEAMRVDNIALFESLLDAAGPVYNDLHRIRLL